MKKTIYLTTLLFSMFFMNFSCEKTDDPIPDVKKTLEQQYPDWNDLQWNSTYFNSDNSNTPSEYPRISFKFNLTGDTLIETFIDHEGDTPVLIPFIDIKLLDGNLVLLTPAPLYGDPNYYKEEKVDNQMTLNEWLFYMNKQGSHRYLLDIN